MTTKISMRWLPALVAAIAILGHDGALAQTGPTPGMGATSPLGSMSFNAPAGPAGIPLGSTELGGGASPRPGVAPIPLGSVELADPGVSPLVGAPAPGIGSSCGTATMGVAPLSTGTTSYGC